MLMQACDSHLIFGVVVESRISLGQAPNDKWLVDYPLVFHIHDREGFRFSISATFPSHADQIKDWSHTTGSAWTGKSSNKPGYGKGVIPSPGISSRFWVHAISS